MEGSEEVAGTPPSPALAELCTSAVRDLSVDGVAVILISRGGQRVLWGSAGVMADRLEEVSALCHEGPAIDAPATGLPVLVGELTAPARTARWPLYTREASGLGISAVFAVPLRIGAISLGVLVAHRGEPGDLGTWELSRMMTAADEATGLALDTEFDAGAGTPNAIQDLGSAEIHQASGMIMVQLGIPIEAALAWLRAHAFAESRSVVDVARDVVSRAIRFEP